MCTESLLVIIFQLEGGLSFFVFLIQNKHGIKNMLLEMTVL